MPEVTEQVQRAVWAAFETRRHLTLDDIEELTEIPTGSTLPYLNSLIRNEYVALTGAGRTPRGEYMPRFSLINYTGPTAPTQFQNARAEIARGRGVLTRKEQPPTPSAKLIAEAMRLNEFTTTEIGDAAGLQNKRTFVSQYLRSLAMRGWIIRLGPRRWQMAGIPTDAQCVMDVLKIAAGGEPVGMDRARKLYGGEIEQRRIGFAVDVMRAQGWIIRQGSRTGRGGKTVYQVEKP